jgi:Secretion system C-terminal sorting domain/Reeler domain
MKKVLYIFSAVATILVFVNNAGGPIVKQQKGYTGAPGDQPSTCITCHNTGTFAPTATLQVFDAAGTTAVTKYALGAEYTLRLTITATSGTPTAFGFQMIDIRKKDSTNVKGFLPKTSQAADIGIDTITTTGRVYAEHNAKLTSNVINVKWKAPATDLGNIVFYAAGNAVNSGGTNAGDNGTASVSFQLASPISSGVNELADNINIQLSPNPTPSVVALRLESKLNKAVKIQIVDLTGRAILSENWNVSIGANQRSVDLKDYAKGVYMVQIIEGQNIVSKKVIKI